MSKIKIKNFGAIKEGYQNDDGWIDIKKVTVFVGNQGSGKSTIAKLISTFTWIEKALVRGDYATKWFEKKNRLKNQFLTYHRLENYTMHDADIEYQGEAYTIRFQNDYLSISEMSNEPYPLPQIMYVPAERNFLTYIKGARELKLSSPSLQEFNTEYDNAKNDMKGSVALPINNTDIEYDKLNNTLNLKGENYKIKITEASSGFQSFVPLHLVSKYLANSVKKQSESKETMSGDERVRFKKGVQEIWNNDNLTDEQKRIALSALSSKFNKTAFVNIVEEPEQNLFPSSQWQMLQNLLEFNNINEGNKLLITTHSPYIINYLTLTVKADELKKKVGIDKVKLQEIVSLDATVNPKDLAIYELDEVSGIIKKLGDYKGLPSDENYLNEGLGKSNDLFVELLKIEDQCQ